MRRFILFACAALAWATDPSINQQRYYSAGPQTVVPGYTFLYALWPQPSVTFSCSSVDSTCQSANYTPDGTEIFVPSDVGLTATGIATLPMGNRNMAPRYYAVNIDGGTGKFQLAYNGNGGNLKETSYLKTAGTNAAATACPDGSWPRIPNDGQGTGLTFSGSGATVAARFQATTAGGVITSTTMIDGGGNFTSLPTTGTLKCNTTSGAAPTTYTLTFSGGALGTFVPITGSGNVTMIIRSGGHGLPSIYLKDVAGTGWPAGTTMKYWTATSSYCTLVASATVPGSGSYAWGYPGQPQCVEVSIPTTATAGTITAGWTFCKDSGGTVDCVDITHPITVVNLPNYTLTAPTAPPALPTYFTQTGVACLASPTGATVGGTDCSFKHLLTSTDQNGYGTWCSKRTTAALNTPDYLLELAGTPQFMAWSLQSRAAYVDGWYYDGMKIYDDIAHFTGDSSWENCAIAYLSRYTQMGPGVTGSAGGIIPNFGANANLVPSLRVPYNTSGTSTQASTSLTPFQTVFHERVFTEGLARGLAMFNNGNYTAGPITPTWNAQMVPPMYAAWQNVGGYPSTTAGDASNSLATVDGSMTFARYTAYQMDTALNIAKHLNPPMRDGSGNLTKFGLAFQMASEALHSHGLAYLNPAISGNWDMGPMGDQTWMIGGLLTESLIDRYEYTHDPIDLYILKGLLDLMHGLYNSGTHFFPQGNTAEGPYCSGYSQLRPGTGWYALSPDFVCSDDSLVAGAYGYQPLNGMFAWAYAWWWQHFGGADNTYATFSDTLAVDGVAVTSSTGAWRFAPKDANQGMGRYGFRYLRARQNRQ